MWTREELAWCAGMIEGEGCVTRNITTPTGSKYNYWQLKVASTDLDVLENLQSILKVGRIYHQRVANEKHKEAWQYKVYRQKDLYAVLAAIYCFMLSRRKERITLALMEMSNRPEWRESGNSHLKPRSRYGKTGK